MNKGLRFTLIACFFALMFLYAGAKAYLDFTRLSLRSANVAGWTASSTDNRISITHVDRDGPANVLRAGDEIVAINGQPLKSYYHIAEFFQNTDSGSSYSVLVRREAQLQSFTLQIVPVPTSWWVGWSIETILNPAIFLITSLTLFLLRPSSKPAVMLALILGMVVPGSMDSFTPDIQPWLALVMVAGFTLSNFIFPLCFHLSLFFPKPAFLLQRFPHIEWVLYLPHLLIRIPYILFGSILLTLGSERRFAAPFPLLYKVNMALALIYLIGALAMLVTNYEHANQVVRRRLRVMTAGTVAGLLPWLILWMVDLTSVFIVRARVSWSVWNWLSAGAYAALPIVPLSITYAIVRHRVIPVSLIIREGLQYLLAKNALRLILLLPTIGLSVAIFSNPNRTLTELLFRNSIYFYALAIIAVAVLLAYRRRLSSTIDRKFFREAYDQEKILRDLVHELKKLDSISDVSKLVSDKVEAALHPERIYLFYREEERRDLSLRYSSGGSQSELRIPEEFELLRFVEYQGSAVDFPFPQKTNLPQNEKDWLARLGTNLIVPMTGTDNRLTGLFLLGQKKSEVPYTANDRELLETLANQIAIVYENARLKERVEKDRQIKHEVLARVEQRDINLLKECPRCGSCFDSTARLCVHDESELTLSLPIERIIEQRYRLDKLIGRGGMGAVYEGVDLRLRRKVALKILKGQLFGKTEALRRFEREAYTSAGLSHPHIVTVYDYGVLTTEGAYLVMELVHGETLGSLLQREKSLLPTTAAAWFDQVLAAVGTAHGAGVIHRDLKPDNIFISGDDADRRMVKVLDFGLAKIVHPDGNAEISAEVNPMTSPGAVVGTFGYMAPEQLLGGNVDATTDLFSIGVIVVEALTGRRPFSGKTYHELLTEILQKPFHLSDDSPEVIELDRVLQKCLAKDSSDRFASAVEMAQYLIPAIGNCPPTVFRRTSEPDADTVILS
ncbi:MAG: protein kinase domain-containing protein [Acidobacteriota bacterium]